MGTKKILSLVTISILFALSTSTAFSQVRFGVKGGIDIIDHKIDFDMLRVSNRLGYQIGGTMEVLSPGSGFGAELSVLYGRKEYKVEEKTLDASISDYDYISVPLVLKKRFGITSVVGVFVSAGAFADIKIGGGNLKIEEYIDKYKSKNFAAGVNAGAGVRLLNNFDLGLYYKATLTERFSIDDPDWDNLNDKKFQSWTVGLTYFF